jgi:hypothetical protein
MRHVRMNELPRIFLIFGEYKTVTKTVTMPLSAKQ